MKIVADQDIPFLQGALEPFAEVVYLPGKEINKKVLKGADALLIRTRTKCTEDLLKDTGIRFIGTATIGFDHIDLGYCSRKKIRWTNAPGCNSSSVQQYIAAALLKLSNDHNFSLEGKTLGIIGVGNVGKKVEKVARILGMELLLNDPPRAKIEGDRGFVNLGNVLYKADIITVHVPLKVVGENKTYHLFNEKNFKKMKKGLFFFNTSRGEISDTVALKNALNSRKLGGAVIDVWENEPDIDLDLMSDAFVATPHIAGYSTDGKVNGTVMVVNALCEFFNLPLKDWFPESIPPPPGPLLTIDGKGKSDTDIIRMAVTHTYDIAADDFRLRFSPADFEKQRSEYPLRREFTSYSLKLNNCSIASEKALEELGFRIDS